MTPDQWAVQAVDTILAGIPVHTVTLRQTSTAQALAVVELDAAWRPHLPESGIQGGGYLGRDVSREAWLYLTPQVPMILGVVVVLVEARDAVGGEA